MLSLTNLRKRNDRGSLELSAVMAIVVLTLVILAIAGSIAVYLRVTSDATLQDQAANAAASVFEEALATSWSDLGHAADDPDLNDARILALAGDATIVTQDPGSFVVREPVRPVREGETENRGTWNQNFTVYTVVTWENEPTVTESGVHTANFGTKRITTQVVWGDGEFDSQTFTITRTPTIAEAVPSNIQVVAGGGLNIERNVFDPVLVGDWETGVLDASIFRAYGYEIHVSDNPAFEPYTVLVSSDENGVVSPCSGDFSEIRESYETSCTYRYMSQYGLTPSFRVMARTLDTDNPNASTDGIKYSNTVTFPGPEVPNLNGSKPAWNQDRIVWSPVLGLFGAQQDLETVIYQNDVEVFRENYTGEAGMLTLDTSADQNNYYVGCLEIGGEEAGCSPVYGPLRTIAVPGQPLNLSGNVTSGPQAEFTWETPNGVEFFNGPGGIGLLYDVQRLNNGSWETVATGLTERSVVVSAPPTADGFVQSEVSVRVRAHNNAGIGPWSSPTTVTLGSAPTRPVVSLSSTVMRSSGSNLVDTTWAWTAGLRATHWEWEYRDPTNGQVLQSGTTQAGQSRTYTAGITYGTEREFRVRGVNEFGASAWDSHVSTIGAAPTGTLSISQSTPNLNSVFVEWSTVPGAEGFEFQYRVNMDCNGSGSTYTWSTSNSAARSVNFSSNVNGGDCFRVRGRAVNQYGNGPWSGWTSSIWAEMSGPGNFNVSATALLTGAQWNASVASCGAGSSPHYRTRNNQRDTSWSGYTPWTDWSTSRARTFGFSAGNVGTMNWQARCINNETGRAGPIGSIVDGIHSHVLVDTSGSTFDVPHKRRLAQVIGSPVPTYGTSTGSFCPTCWSSDNYSRDLQLVIMDRFHQRVDITHDRSSGSSRDASGIWGDYTTNGLIRMGDRECPNVDWAATGFGTSSTSWTSWSSTVKNRLATCMNSENFFGTWDRR